MDTNSILVLNAGSSSLKFTLYLNAAASQRDVAARGQIEGIGTVARLVAADGSGREIANHPLAHLVKDGNGALSVLAQWLGSRFRGMRLSGVGHRVVHGGTHYRAPTLVTSQVIVDLRALVPLAPLHQPYNVAAIMAVAEQLPEVPQVACFDTSFHAGHPAVADIVPLPRKVRAHGVRRYGFHGLSYEYIASVLPRVAPDIANGRVIVAHLGSGASLCALKQGASVDCTFGFTALDGLCMGTRPGSVDPGVILYLFQGLGLPVAEVEAMLYTKSGLLGISGMSSDMRELLASAEPSARLAVDYFVYRAAQQIGALAATLGGIDALVFTAGIGANSAEIRRRICESSAWLGVELDVAANDAGASCISPAGARVSAWVIPTDEEWMIARHTRATLGLER